MDHLQAAGYRRLVFQLVMARTPLFTQRTLRFQDIPSLLCDGTVYPPPPTSPPFVGDRFCLHPS